MKKQPLTWWLWRFIITLGAGVPMLIGGCLLLAGASDGLYWVAAAILATLVATVWNSWVLLIRFCAEDRSGPSSWRAETAVFSVASALTFSMSTAQVSCRHVGVLYSSSASAKFSGRGPAVLA